MSINWPATFERIVKPTLPLQVRVATFEDDHLYVGDQTTWHFNTSSAWRLRDTTSAIVGWSWPSASDLVWDLCGHELVGVALQTERVPIDPVLLFDGDWSLEVFGDQSHDPWTLHLPTGVLVGDGAV